MRLYKRRRNERRSLDPLQGKVNLTPHPLLRRFRSFFAPHCRCWPIVGCIARRAGSATTESGTGARMTESAAVCRSDAEGHWQGQKAGYTRGL